MMMRGILAAAALLAAGSVAQAAGLFGILGELRNGDDPLYCHSPVVLGDITERFQWADHETWGKGLRIARIDGVRDTTRGPGRYQGMVGRRTCQADVWLNDGSRDRLYYLIAYPLGFAGTGSSVQFCLPKHDRWRVYGASCRSVRP